jgi:hypothetical protein
MLWLLIPYALIALPVTLLTARHAWRHGTSDGMRPGNAGGAWVIGLLVGAIWPVYGIFLALVALYACLVEFVLLPLSRRWFGDPDGAAEQREHVDMGR